MRWLPLLLIPLFAGCVGDSEPQAKAEPTGFEAIYDVYISESETVDLYVNLTEGQTVMNRYRVPVESHLFTMEMDEPEPMHLRAYIDANGRIIRAEQDVDNAVSVTMMDAGFIPFGYRMSEQIVDDKIMLPVDHQELWHNVDFDGGRFQMLDPEWDQYEVLFFDQLPVPLRLNYAGQAVISRTSFEWTTALSQLPETAIDVDEPTQGERLMTWFLQENEPAFGLEPWIAFYDQYAARYGALEECVVAMTYFPFPGDDYDGYFAVVSSSDGFSRSATEVHRIYDSPLGAADPTQLLGNRWDVGAPEFEFVEPAPFDCNLVGTSMQAMGMIESQELLWRLPLEQTGAPCISGIFDKGAIGMEWYQGQWYYHLLAPTFLDNDPDFEFTPVVIVPAMIDAETGGIESLVLVGDDLARFDSGDVRELPESTDPNFEPVCLHNPESSEPTQFTSPSLLGVRSDVLQLDNLGLP